MGKAQAQPNYPRGITFEDVWASLMETRERQEKDAREWRERHEKAAREWEEQRKKDAREWEEQRKKDAREWEERHEKDAREREERREKDARKWEERREKDTKEWKERHEEIRQLLRETDKQMKETDKRLAKQLGELGNRLGEVIESMVEPNLVAKFRELGFDFDKIHHGTKIEDKDGNVLAEADFSLENYDKVMLVEVKVKPTIYDVKYHIERIGEFRTQADLRGERHVFLGAVAGVIINKGVRNFALKNGFYIIQPSGDTFIITVPEGIYSPREW